MGDSTIFSRSFSRHEQKLFCVIGCFIIAMCFCTVFKPYLSPSPFLSLRLSIGGGLRMLMTKEEKYNAQKPYNNIKKSKLFCNVSERISDICAMEGDIRIHGNSSTIFVASSRNNSWSIRPYARKGDENAMKNVRKFTVKTSQKMPRCTKNQTVPAIVFSAGGYAGNHFHDFSDVVIPLFSTSQEFNGEVQFLISHKNSWWTNNKFWKVLRGLSNYKVIDIDKEEGIHCFPKMIVGLKAHKELRIDPSTSQHSMKDFREFLRKTYSLKRETAIKLREGEQKRPRILIITRKKTRAFVNEDEIANVTRSLGFEVIVTEADSKLSQFSQVVNSCDVIMGVHGAGLTNIVFLPENGILIQVVPLGNMEGIARVDFGEPAKSMKLRYLEYKIIERESTLMQQYPIDHPVFKDPCSIRKKGWGPYGSVYLVKQSVKLDVARFRGILLEALKLLHE